MRIVLVVVGLLSIFAVPFLIFGDRYETAAVIDFFRSDSPWAALLGVMAISLDLVIPFPAHTIMTSFGMMHGWFVGGLLASAGTFTAGMLAYWLCRLLGQRAVSFIAGEGASRTLHSFFERYGLWSIAVSRWLPAVPEIVSSLAGATGMAQSRFLIGNLMGSLSVGFAYGAIGSASNVPAYLLTAISLVVPLIMLLVFSLLIARAR